MTTLLVAALLAPAQAGELKLSNVRNTYGLLGGTRPAGKFLPGDTLFVGFDIDGITIGADGRAQYRMAMEVLDKAGKPVFKQEPADKVDYVPLGGTRLPGRAYVIIGLDMQAGQYSMKLTVTDTATKKEQSFSHPFEVEKAGFGVVDVRASVDESGQIPTATTGVVGQAVFVHLDVVGFERDKDPARKDPKGGFQPNLTVEMLPHDEAGKPTLSKPASYTQALESQAVTHLKDDDVLVNVRFLVPLTRVGKFTVKLKATDNVSKKTATFDLPLTVVGPAN